MERIRRVTTPIPAIQGKFGPKLLSFQAQLHPSDVKSVLGHDPRSDHWKTLPTALRERYEHIQRTTDKGRRESLMLYIDEHIGLDGPVIGAFPAICIGMTTPPVFVPIVEQDPSIGFLQLTSGDHTMILLDGLARVTAALAALDAHENSHGNGSSWDLFSFPVTFYSPEHGTLTLDELGQLFYDFNYLQKRIAPQHAIALDQHDLYIRLTNALGTTGVLKQYGGMDMRTASLTKNSKAVVVQKVLLRFVRGACEGWAFQQSNHASTDNPHLMSKTYATIADEMNTYLEAFATKMGEARFTDRDSLHLTAPGWQVLGLVFHDLYLRLGASPSTVESVIQRLASLDWSRFNPDWIPYLGEAETHKATGLPVQDAKGRARLKITRLGSNGIRRLKDYVYDKTGLSVLTADLNTEEAAA